MLTHKGTVKLTTPRLLLRRFAPEDAQGVYDGYTSDALVSERHNLDAHASVEETRTMLAGWIAQYGDPRYYHWAIEHEGAVIGEINLFDVADGPERCELGYTIGSKWWNSGFATEAAAEVLRFAFEEVHFHRVYARHDPENAASGKVMRKIGMRQEGLFREHSVRQDGTKGDVAFYGILRSEWAAHACAPEQEAAIGNLHR